MKILFIHNKYGVTSGEEVMVQRIIDLLQGHGHEVQCYFRDSREIDAMFMGRVRSFFSGIFSSQSRREIKRVLREFQPDLVQVQNLFPLISPAILPVIRAAGVPIVMRLSNYRLVCPNGLMLSHQALCKRCLGGREFCCVLQNCEGSFLKSFGYGLRNWVARTFRFYLDNVTMYYAQTLFQKEILVGEGFAAERIAVIPNMVQVEDVVDGDDVGGFVGFAGRISPEKGVETLVAAAERCGELPFKLAGEYGRMQELVDAAPANVVFDGRLDRDALREFYRECRFLVVPSLWYEGFPGVILEAMLQGKPVICSRIGGLPEIVEDGKTGLLFEPGDADDLAVKIMYLWERPELCAEMGAAGRDKVLQEYSPEKYYKRLMRVYDNAVLMNREALSSS